VFLDGAYRDTKEDSDGDALALRALAGGSSELGVDRVEANVAESVGLDEPRAEHATASRR
jgi:hypothetical protein